MSRTGKYTVHHFEISVNIYLQFGFENILCPIKNITASFAASNLIACIAILSHNPPSPLYLLIPPLPFSPPAIKQANTVHLGTHTHTHTSPLLHTLRTCLRSEY